MLKSRDIECPKGCIKFNTENRGFLVFLLLSLIFITAMLITNCVLYSNATDGNNNQISSGWATFLTWINGIFAALAIVFILWIGSKLVK
jgi:uncharacterized membrane protein